jgi:hypothetical protein
MIEIFEELKKDVFLGGNDQRVVFRSQKKEEIKGRG